MTALMTSPHESHGLLKAATARDRGRRRAIARDVAGEPPVTAWAGAGNVDRACVTAMRNGSERAFCELVDRYAGQMLRFAQCYVRDPAVASEIVRDTWVQALSLVARCEEGVVFKTWLFGVLHRTASGRRERESGMEPFSSWMAAGDSGVDDHPAPVAHAPTGDWSSPPDPWDADDVARLRSPSARSVIDQAIAALPDRQRQVITLRDVEGWSADEVSDLLGISEGGQRLLLHRARTKVRAALDAYLTPAAA